MGRYRRLVALLLVAACSSSDAIESSSTAGEAVPTTTASSEPAVDTETAASRPPATSTTVVTSTVVEPALVVPALGFLHAEPDPVEGGRIVDDQGREVLLRGTNVNSYVDYWSGNRFPTVFEFTEADADRIASIGWNTVRLLFSWSRVEPEPGVYDEEYLDTLEDVVRMLEARGIYTVLDAHQDAWGPTLAARPDEVCSEGTIPAIGWDGAPGWATLVDDATARCASAGIRETSPAVREAFGNFFANAEGPGGVGIRTRYAQMWGHIAGRFATQPAVAGYDVMNEPNAFTDDEQRGLAELYSESLAAIRAAEQEAGGPSHLVLFEPSALWSSIGAGPPPQWSYDRDVVYSPHIYQGAFNGDPITRDAFVVAVEEAKLFGGAPILTGEWGTAFENHSGTQRTGLDGDGYFIDHQRWQDEFRVHATIWEWRESCGDPHKVKPEPVETQQVAGIYEIDCSTNEIVAERTELIEDLTRAYAVASPGKLSSSDYTEESGAFEVIGVDAQAGVEVLVFYPTSKHGRPLIEGEGVEDIAIVDGPAGATYVTAITTDAQWGLRMSAG